MPSPDRPVVYILGTFPQASQTFIHREIRGLLDLGVPLRIYALRRRDPSVLEPADRAWYGQVIAVPRSATRAVVTANLRWLLRDPAAYLRAARRLVALPQRRRLLRVRSIALFLTAVWIAGDIGRRGGCRYVHAHFALAQTEVAMAVSLLIGQPFGFTAHARDIYATPSALPEKIRAASLVVTCTGYNERYLRSLCPDLPDARVALVYHGIPPFAVPARDRHRGVPQLLAAGRLVEKKGFDVLVAACAILRDRGVPFGLRIAGAGRLEASLARAIRQAGLEEHVRLSGWLLNEALIVEMRQAALFVVPSRVTAEGDRDGIPNVLLEAMAVECPVVATAVSAIPEAVTDGETGRLVPPGDAQALAGAIEGLLNDEPRRRRFGAAARARIACDFDLRVSSERLAAVFPISWSRDAD